MHFLVSSCLGVILLGSSCFSNSKNCTKISLSTEEKKWIDNYKEGDLLLFKCKAEIDTFLVTSKGESFTTCNKFELGENQYNYKGVHLKSSKCHGSSKCDVNLLFTKEQQTKSSLPCIKKFDVFDLRSYTVSDIDSLVNDTIKVLAIKEKLPTYYCEAGPLTTDVNGGEQMIISFHWNKRYGLVRYTLKSGKTYDFWKKN